MAAQRLCKSCLVFDPPNENKLIMRVFIVEVAWRIIISQSAVFSKVVPGVEILGIFFGLLFFLQMENPGTFTSCKSVLKNSNIFSTE